MGRTARSKNERFRPPPVQRIEIDDEHSGRKAAIAIVLLAVGVILLVYAVMQFVLPERGWQAIEAGASAAGGGEDFTFLYNSDSSGGAKTVKGLYTSACLKSFHLFHSDQSFGDVTNVYDINHHPNEILEVDEALYEAFVTVAESGRRELYLGPVYNRYDDLFFIEDVSQMADYDPRLSGDVRREYDGILAYANDPGAINLELLGENRVRLAVSPEYLSWAEQEGITKFIDFSWMRNAFIGDYLAGELTAAGYTKGALSSYDGFARNLDGSGEEYVYAVYHRQGDAIYPVAEMKYRGPMSFVRLRDYPISQRDLQHYYPLPDGETRTSYLDTADALCKSSIDTLVCYQQEKGCAQLLLEMIPVYIADEFREEAIPALAEEGIQSIYCRDRVVRHTEPEIVLDNLYDEEGVRYTTEQIHLP